MGICRSIHPETGEEVWTTWVVDNNGNGMELHCGEKRPEGYHPTSGCPINIDNREYMDCLKYDYLV